MFSRTKESPYYCGFCWTAFSVPPSMSPSVFIFLPLSVLVTVQHAGVSTAVTQMMKGRGVKEGVGWRRESGAWGWVKEMGRREAKAHQIGRRIVAAHNKPCVDCVVDSHWLPMWGTMTEWKWMGHIDDPCLRVFRTLMYSSYGTQF